jgi:HD superfamily phosphodiesterase
MIDQQLSFFQGWFRQHTLTFREDNPQHQHSLDLKTEHTFRVCAASSQIAAGLGLGENDHRIATVIALFHDLGRLPQYRQYRTFRDSDSDNHAKLSLWELNRHRVLHILDPAERQTISRAIFFHNRRHLPDNLDKNTLLHCQLIRDADKIDILRVMIEHFHQEESQRNPVVTLGLKDDPLVRDEVFLRLLTRKTMSYTRLQTINELKVLQMGWVFDINFLPALTIINERNDIGRLAATMPETPQLREAVDFINDHIERRLQSE